MTRLAAALLASAGLHAVTIAGLPVPAGTPEAAGVPSPVLDVQLNAVRDAPKPISAGPKPRASSQTPAASQTPGVIPAPHYLRASELDEKPVPLTHIEPVPPESAAAKVGRVVARVLINESGAADAVRVESSEPQALFDEAVVSAFGSARYRPGMKGGRAVKSQMRVEVMFGR
jgi:TonB family protein